MEPDVSVSRIMRADICDPTDGTSMERFRVLLVELGAMKKEHSWAVGVDTWLVQVRGMELRIYRDTWSLDIEGPDELVTEIRQRMLH